MNTQSNRTSSRGVVAAGHELTVQAAEIVLREGGNAFDAIVAAHFAACATEPILASLGGGGFMIAQPRDGTPAVYDFFVQTPRRKRTVDESSFRPIWADFGATRQEFHIGQGTIATPGTVKGLFQIHRDLGSLPMSQIVAPAVRYAREGVVLNDAQAYILQIVSPICMATPEARAVYCGAPTADRVLRAGELLSNPDLADTMQRLAQIGEDLFYRGDIGREIVGHCDGRGGCLTWEDLEGYEVLRREPLEMEYCGARVLTNPPPSSGGVLIAFALELLAASAPIPGTPGSSEYLRTLAEVMTLTNQARRHSLNQDSPPQSSEGRLFDSGYLDRYRAEVGRRAQAIRGTTHFSVIDAWGNAASMTVSNGEGCGSIVSGTGIMLNNMLGEQDLNLGGFHQWRENERMTSMMAPSLLRLMDGALVATGSGGSNRIRTALLQVIMNLIHFQMDVEEAVLFPRVHLEDEKLSVEGGFPTEEVEALVTHYPDHEVWSDRNLFFGGAHTVVKRNGAFAGVGDPRRGGVCRVVE